MKMELFRKYRILKLIVVCLACISANKADDLLDKNISRDFDNGIISTVSGDENNIIKTGYSSFSMPETQCRIPRQSNFSISLRTFGQAQRNNSTNSSRNGFTLMKSGKSMNEYSTSLFHTSILNFPSGMSESTHHLISLGKLII